MESIDIEEEPPDATSRRPEADQMNLLSFLKKAITFV